MLTLVAGENGIQRAVSVFGKQRERLTHLLGRHRVGMLCSVVLCCALLAGIQ